jgi:phosphoserine phosphatase RsbU/P
MQANGQLGGELREFKPDRIPIGYFEKLGEFTNSEVKICKGDIVYLFSDGYIDQFGGPSSKRFQLKRFRALLQSIHKLPLEQQKEKLLDSFNEWKASGDQTDDILVIGLKV